MQPAEERADLARPLDHPGHSSSLREAKAGTQTGRSLETGTDAETMEEHCLRICSCWLALFDCPGVACSVLSISAPAHTEIGSLTADTNKCVTSSQWPLFMDDSLKQNQNKQQQQTQPGWHGLVYDWPQYVGNPKLPPTWHLVSPED